MPWWRVVVQDQARVAHGLSLAEDSHGLALDVRDAAAGSRATGKVPGDDPACAPNGVRRSWAAPGPRYAALSKRNG